jgi:hypothetical protein
MKRVILSGGAASVFGALLIASVVVQAGEVINPLHPSYYIGRPSGTVFVGAVEGIKGPVDADNPLHPVYHAKAIFAGIAATSGGESGFEPAYVDKLNPLHPAYAR